jgi:16S rRNA (cytosine1402-N4)-methyltransferase
VPGGVSTRAGPLAGWHHFPGARRLAVRAARMESRPGTELRQQGPGTRTGQHGAAGNVSTATRDEGVVHMGKASGHVPVMLDQVAALLGPALAADGAVLLDATLGRAGHTRALLAAYPGLMVIGVDADTTAIEESRAALAGDASRVTLVHSFYDEIPAIVAAAGLDSVQGVLFDLGVSSPQLDDRERGFAYSYDAPLDMRMDQTAELTAEEVVNHYSAADLARVLRDYGEERFARRIADALVRERTRTPVTSTARLSEIVRDSIPAAARRTGGHPAKRTFQALRIEVNGELAVLGRALPAALDLLSVGGRIAVLAYHSLEDRVVKRALAAATEDTTPKGLPVPLPDSGPRFRLLTRGAMRPTPDELTDNPRAASARLRAAERIRQAA